MKIVKHKLLSYVLNVGPFFLFFKLAYKICYRVTQLMMLPNLKVWCRNSFYFNSITIGQSDIDYTTVLTSEYELELFKDKYSTIKEFIPVNGEFNAYLRSDCEQFTHVFDNLEITRDPMLLKVLDLSKPNWTQAKAAALCARQALADFDNLNSDNALKNFNKWNYLLSIIESDTVTDIVDFHGVYLLLIEHFEDFARSEAELVSIIDSIAHNKNRISNNLFCSEAIILYPQFWYLGHNHETQERSFISMIESSSTLAQEVFLETARLELFGLLSQHRLLADSWFLTEIHIPMIASILEKSDVSDSLKTSFLDLAQEYRRLAELHLKN